MAQHNVIGARLLGWAPRCNLDELSWCVTLDDGCERIVAAEVVVRRVGGAARPLLLPPPVRLACLLHPKKRRS